jgi:predicted SAM-dependent methyltransferase
MTSTPEPLSPHTSECSLVRHLFAPYLDQATHPYVLEMGAGGDLTVPHALAFDMPSPYTNVGGSKQFFKGDCGNLGFLCDETIDGIATHHLLEDFSYTRLRQILNEWRRVLKTGGVICINCPDQQRYLDHCRKTGQGINMGHCEPDFSVGKFKALVVKTQTGNWEILEQKDNIGNYSWIMVIKKI